MKTTLLFLFFIFSLKNYSQCTNVPSNSTSSNLTYTFVGGSFQSYGCAPIDPTRWLAGNGISVTVTFTSPQDYPRFRVWGMNNDDVASVMVNNVSYPMNATSATYLPKVVCGISPGPDGIVFTGGNIVGANSNADGNYSYSDIQLTTTGVNSFKVTGISGAGWGFASTLVFCPPILSNEAFDWNEALSIYSQNSELHIDTSNELLNANLIIYDVQGKEILKSKINSYTNSYSIGKGIYLIKLEKEGEVFTKKTMVN